MVPVAGILAGGTIATVAVADLVGSEALVVVMVTVAGEGAVAGAV